MPSSAGGQTNHYNVCLAVSMLFSFINGDVCPAVSTLFSSISGDLHEGNPKSDDKVCTVLTVWTRNPQAILVLIALIK